MRITDQCYAVCMADSPKRSLLYGRRDVQGSHAQNHVEAKQVMSVALAVNQRPSVWSSGEGAAPRGSQACAMWKFGPGLARCPDFLGAASQQFS